MTTNAPATRVLLLTTLVLALAGDTLLRAEPWGINFTVLALLLFSGILFLSLRLRDPIPLEGWSIAALGLLTAACLSWRDSTDLAAFNVLATLAAAHLVTARKNAGELPRMTFIEHIQHAILQVVHLSVGSAFLLLRDLRTENGDGEGRPLRRNRVWLGIALAVPALLLFGSLLISADATFEYLIVEVLRIDIWTLLGHAALIAFLAWTAGGWLRGRFFATEFASFPVLLPKRVSLGVTELAILLGSLDVMFGAFVLFPIPNFFGSHATILGTPALTYAQYARRGFFELITVAALGLPLLVAADWLFRTELKRERRIIRALSITMIVFLGVMLASAIHRLSLYIEAYGLTTARVHAAAILIWIAITLLLFCLTVLRGKRNLLPFAVAVSGFIVLLGLNAANPDALVARVNTTRMVADGKFDPQYTFRLGADAVPILLEAIPVMEAGHQSALAERLLEWYGDPGDGGDLRSWNAARMRAADLVRGRITELRSYILPEDTTVTPER